MQSNLDKTKLKGDGFFFIIARSRYIKVSLYRGRDKKIAISRFLKQKNNIQKKYLVKNFYLPYAFKLNVLIFRKKICYFGLFGALHGLIINVIINVYNGRKNRIRHIVTLFDVCSHFLESSFGLPGQPAHTPLYRGQARIFSQYRGRLVIRRFFLT